MKCVDSAPDRPQLQQKVRSMQVLARSGRWKKRVIMADVTRETLDYVG